MIKRAVLTSLLSFVSLSSAHPLSCSSALVTARRAPQLLSWRHTKFRICNLRSLSLSKHREQTLPASAWARYCVCYECYIWAWLLISNRFDALLHSAIYFVLRPLRFRSTMRYLD